MTGRLLISAVLLGSVGCIDWDAERDTYCANGGSGCRAEELPDGGPGTIAVTSGSGQTRPVRDPFADLVVEARRPDGGPAEAVTLELSLPTTEPTGSFDNAGQTATVDTDVAGRATLPTVFAGSQPGSYQVVVRAAGFTELRIPLSTTLGPPAHLEQTGGALQSTQVDTEFADPLSVKVTDSGGNPLATVTVTFTVTSAPVRATFVTGSASDTQLTDASGTATSVKLRAGTSAGSATVQAAAGDTLTDFTDLVMQPGPVASVTLVDGDGQRTTAGEPFPLPLRVRAADAHGNPIPGHAVSFDNGVSGAHCLFDGLGSATVTSDPDGLAAALCVTAPGQGGGFNVMLDDPELGALGPVFSLEAGVPAALALISGDNQQPDVDGVYPLPLVVRVEDSTGSPLPNARVQFDAPVGPGASLTFASTGTTSEVVVSGANGVATSSTMFRLGIGDGFTVSAQVLGYPAATTNFVEQN